MEKSQDKTRQDRRQEKTCAERRDIRHTWGGGGHDSTQDQKMRQDKGKDKVDTERDWWRQDKKKPKQNKKINLSQLVKKHRIVHPQFQI